MAVKRKLSESSRFKSYEGALQKDRHLRLTHFMMTHAAYKDLSSSAKVLYSYMKLWACGNDEVTFAGSLSLTVMTKDTFTKAKKELISKGFIEPLNIPGHKKQAGQYKFSNRWYVQ